VREAIDRGVPIEEVKPGNAIATALKKLVIPQGATKQGTAKPAARPASPAPERTPAQTR